MSYIDSTCNIGQARRPFHVGSEIDNIADSVEVLVDADTQSAVLERPSEVKF